MLESNPIEKKPIRSQFERKIIIFPSTSLQQPHGSKLAQLAKKTSPSSLLYFLHPTRYCCFRLHNGISRLFADTNVRDHPSFVARARSQPCLCPIPCIVDTHRVGTPTCVEFESITNLSVPLYLSLSLPSTHTLRTRQFLSFFTSFFFTLHIRVHTCWNVFLLCFLLARFGYKWDGRRMDRGGEGSCL